MSAGYTEYRVLYGVGRLGRYVGYEGGGPRTTRRPWGGFGSLVFVFVVRCQVWVDEERDGMLGFAFVEMGWGAAINLNGMDE